MDEAVDVVFCYRLSNSLGTFYVDVLEVEIPLMAVSAGHSKGEGTCTAYLVG